MQLPWLSQGNERSVLLPQGTIVVPAHLASALFVQLKRSTIHSNVHEVPVVVAVTVLVKLQPEQAVAQGPV
ncbi:MAG: hypothetical protein O2816_12625 [Planctomycetota bacterium]|nr:hypothetical protein [Planctomycetota bacterium]